MKYYSEKLEKIFDSVEDLKNAEAAQNEKEKLEEQWEKKLDELYHEIIEKCEEYISVYEDFMTVKEKSKCDNRNTAVDFSDLIKALFE